MAIVASGLEIAFWSIIIPSVIGIAMKLFSSFFYAIGKLLFWVIDLLQTVFRKLAGLDTIWMNGEQADGDILLSIFRSQVVVDTLISVTVFAVALVIVATIVQMVRTEYTTEGSKNSKEGILGQALKSLVMFILIPVVCFFGIRVSNYLLQAVDYATSSGGSQSISGAIFNASTIDANKVVNETDGEHEFSDLTIGGILDWVLPNTNGAKGVKYNDNGAIMKFEETLKSNQSDDTKARQEIGKKIDQLMAMNKESAKKFGSAGYGEGVNPTGEIYYGNIAAVRYFYDMGEINFLILYVGAFLVLQALFNASMGLVVRMYKATALFVIAPAAIGLQPLDGGNAYKSWKKSFLSTVLAAYGVIVALNIFFVVAGVVSQIELWDPKGSFLNYGLNKFMQALFIVVGATQIKGLAKTMGDLIGGADAMSEGASATGDATRLVGSVAKVGVGAAVAGKAIGHYAAGGIGAIGSAINKRRADNHAKMGQAQINQKTADKVSKADAKIEKKYGAVQNSSGEWVDKSGTKITDTKLLGKINTAHNNAANWYSIKQEKYRNKIESGRAGAARNFAKAGQSFNAVAGMIEDSAPAKTLMGLTGGSVFKSAASGKMFKEYDEEFAKTGIPQAAGLKSGTKLEGLFSDAMKGMSTGISRAAVNGAIGYKDSQATASRAHSVVQSKLDEGIATNNKYKDAIMEKTTDKAIGELYDVSKPENAGKVNMVKSLISDSSLSADNAKDIAYEILGDMAGKSGYDDFVNALREVVNTGDAKSLSGLRDAALDRFGAKGDADAYRSLNLKNAQIEEMKTRDNEAFNQTVKDNYSSKSAKQYSEEMKNALENGAIKIDDDETQETLRQLLKDGVIKTQEEGEKSVKLDYAKINQAITDAINKQKQEDAAAAKETKSAKEQAKLLQDILKELKKKK